MFIKQVIVNGFRSYKDETFVDPFDKQHNIVIGRNGTGKSNFFDAIQFVLLTSRFSNLRQDERQALLYEGSGKHVMSAFVEIVFDNADGRLVMDSTEVTLRRTIGIKKDEFFVNQKHITKNDVYRLLESAGFSKSNPYYIVQQGKVNSLAMMRDKDRLELLKEVAGTNVYEERRLESIGILHDTNNKHEKIQSVLDYIQERLNELEGEKEELQAYEKLDREKRALEYSFHKLEMDLDKEELERMEEERLVAALKHTEMQKSKKGNVEEMKSVQVKMKELVQSEKWRREDIVKIEGEEKELRKNVFKVNLEMKELKVQYEMEKVSVLENKKELDKVEEKIEKVKEDIRIVVEEELNRMEEEKRKCDGDLHLYQSKAEVLVAKQSRKTQFKSQNERDAYLEKEIQQVNTLIKEKSNDLMDLKTSLQKMNHDVNMEKRLVQDGDQSKNAIRDKVKTLSESIQRLKSKRNDLAEERKDLWRIESQHAKQVQVAKEQVRMGQDALYKTMSYDVRRGLQAVKTMNVDGVYGPLIELVKPVDDRFCTAMDEAAGGALFHVVVDTDATAAALMKELGDKKLGRVTFLPLNRLQVSNVSYPKNDDVLPLIDKLEYDSVIEKAVKSAFGKKLLCRDLNTCTQYAASANMDCLTLDGDVVHRRGGLNGGYKDPSKSRTRSMELVRHAKETLEKETQDANKAKEAAESMDQAISNILSQLQKLELDQNSATEMLQQISSSQEASRVTIRKTNALMDVKNKLAASTEIEMEELKSKVVLLQDEMNTSIHDALTADETEDLHAYFEKIGELEKSTATLQNQIEKFESKRNSLESLLNDNLELRRAELVAQLEKVACTGVESQDNAAALTKKAIDSKELDLEQATQLLDQNSSFLQAEIEAVDKITAELELHHTRLEKLKLEAQEHDEKLLSESHASEKILNRRSRLLEKREETMRSIRELGTLPMTEVSSFESLSLKAVKKKLHSCTKQLQKYNHVNKKALDQYVSFNEQRTTLIERLKEVNMGKDSIEELIDVLDKRKDEAILRTFKGVSHHFQEVFSELVPDGTGRMLIVRSDGEDSTSEKQATYETFVGVQIKVSFRGEGEAYLMQQLSGGQKALVALAFIFAIQRCDPAPFYLFDEIDQALDATHRTAVAALIHRQAHANDNPAQFITSTFRPELVEVADKFYGIGHQNKISDIHVMTKSESMDFIDELMAEEEGVVRVSKKRSKRNQAPP